MVRLKQFIFQSRHEHLSDEGAQWRSNRDPNVRRKSVEGIIQLTYELFLAKPNQVTLLGSGEMELLFLVRSPISPDFGSVTWLGLAK